MLLLFLISYFLFLIFDFRIIRYAQSTVLILEFRNLVKSLCLESDPESASFPRSSAGSSSSSSSGIGRESGGGKGIKGDMSKENCEEKRSSARSESEREEEKYGNYMDDNSYENYARDRGDNNYNYNYNCTDNHDDIGCKSNRDDDKGSYDGHNNYYDSDSQNSSIIHAKSIIDVTQTRTNTHTSAPTAVSTQERTVSTLARTVAPAPAPAMNDFLSNLLKELTDAHRTTFSTVLHQTKIFINNSNIKDNETDDNSGNKENYYGDDDKNGNKHDCEDDQEYLNENYNGNLNVNENDHYKEDNHTPKTFQLLSSIFSMKATSFQSQSQSQSVVSDSNLIQSGIIQSQNQNQNQVQGTPNSSGISGISVQGPPSPRENNIATNNLPTHNIPGNITSDTLRNSSWSSSSDEDESDFKKISKYDFSKGSFCVSSTTLGAGDTVCDLPDRDRGSLSLMGFICPPKADWGRSAVLPL